MWRYLILLFVLVGCVEVKPTPVTVANKPAGVAWFLEPKYLEGTRTSKREEVLNLKRNELQYPWENKVVSSGLETNITCVRTEQECPLYDDVCISNVRKCSPNNVKVIFDYVLKFRSEWWEKTTDFDYPINWFSLNSTQINTCCYADTEIKQGIKDISEQLTRYKDKEKDCRDSSDCLTQRVLNKDKLEKLISESKTEQLLIESRYKTALSKYNNDIDKCNSKLEKFKRSYILPVEYFASACWLFENIDSQKEEIKGFWEQINFEKSNPTGLYSKSVVYEAGKEIQIAQNTIRNWDVYFTAYIKGYNKVTGKQFNKHKCKTKCSSDNYCFKYNCSGDEFKCSIVSINDQSLHDFYNNIYNKCTDQYEDPKTEVNKFLEQIKMISKTDDDFQSLVLSVRDLIK
jgi:hypothetical protein